MVPATFHAMLFGVNFSVLVALFKVVAHCFLFAELPLIAVCPARENWIFSEDVPHQVETKDLKPVS